MAPISRRTLFNRGLLLVAAAGGAAVGLTRTVHHKVNVAPPAPPQALVSLLSNQQALITGYDAALKANAASTATLTALQSDVSAHHQAVAAVLQSYPGWRLSQAGPSGSSTARPTSSSPAVAPVLGTTAALAAATEKLATSAATACLSWPGADGTAKQVVPLLGSISACLSTHLAVLS